MGPPHLFLTHFNQEVLEYKSDILLILNPKSQLELLICFLPCLPSGIAE